MEYPKIGTNLLDVIKSLHDHYGVSFIKVNVEAKKLYYMPW